MKHKLERKATNCNKTAPKERIIDSMKGTRKNVPKTDEKEELLDDNLKSWKSPEPEMTDTANKELQLMQEA